jgi:hypothetical protein
VTTVLNFPHIPPVDTDAMELPVSRNFLTRVASFVNVVAEDVKNQQWRRDDARRLFNEISEELAFTVGIDSHREHGHFMAWPKAATVEVDIFLNNLPLCVVEDNPIYTVMAYRMAEIVDMSGHSTDFRTEALAQLNHIIGRLRDLATFDDLEEAAAE